MKSPRFLSTLLASVILLTGCSHFFKNDTATSQTPAPSQSKQCHEMKRRLMMAGAGINGDRTAETNNQIQQLQSEYRAANCQ